MRLLAVLAAVFGITCCLAVPASAAISFNITSGSGSVSVAYEGQVTFPDFGGYTGLGTIIDKGINDLNPLVVDVTYALADLDVTSHGGAFRWAERVTNNSASNWLDYHIDLVDDTGTFGGEFWFQGSTNADVPAMASIGSLVSPVTIDLLAHVGSPDPSGNVMTLSADKQHIDIVFGTPIGPGETFDIHIPIENLGLTAGDTGFLLTQTPTVPEPASLVVWGLLGLGWVGLCVWRRRR